MNLYPVPVDGRMNDRNMSREYSNRQKYNVRVDWTGNRLLSQSASMHTHTHTSDISVTLMFTDG